MAEGAVEVVGCVNRDLECCVAEIDLAVKNCSAGFVVYRLEPTPGCDMGYCAGQGLPCPKGLASDTGFTPCECKLHIRCTS